MLWFDTRRSFFVFIIHIYIYSFVNWKYLGEVVAGFLINGYAV